MDTSGNLSIADRDFYDSVDFFSRNYVPTSTLNENEGINGFRFDVSWNNLSGYFDTLNAGDRLTYSLTYTNYFGKQPNDRAQAYYELLLRYNTCAFRRSSIFPRQIIESHLDYVCPVAQCV